MTIEQVFEVTTDEVCACCGEEITVSGSGAQLEVECRCGCSLAVA